MRATCVRASAADLIELQRRVNRGRLLPIAARLWRALRAPLADQKIDGSRARAPATVDRSQEAESWQLGRRSIGNLRGLVLASVVGWPILRLGLGTGVHAVRVAEGDDIAAAVPCRRCGANPPGGQPLPALEVDELGLGEKAEVGRASDGRKLHREPTGPRYRLPLHGPVHGGRRNSGQGGVTRA